ncbi:Methyltransferase type 11 [Rhodovulum sp. P5]|uniref:class I SAM-dependent methyltransferase n=1 Tax=Rhodovulum sp. P5 TaxID=1564506 RepID=UPI0009C1C205|nr:class I SAM-dependent methyltransferase [Rhodovulum sp. P5]ARE38795.1 Methyltransferase type 11 [Rhodovulum sp. P5]
MKTDTAHEHWNTEWAEIQTGSKWLTPEPEVSDWAGGLVSGARILDLGAGVGRHALSLASAGFDVTALDAAPDGIATIRRAAQEGGVALTAVEGAMTDLPFEDDAFDHVLSWNVIYHGDETVLRTTIAEIARVLKPGGTFLGTMLSARRIPVEQAKAPGREISRNTWVFEGEGDKVHPHYFCNAADLIDLFDGFELLQLEDREHEKPGSWHWHLVMERL